MNELILKEKDKYSKRTSRTIFILIVLVVLLLLFMLIAISSGVKSINLKIVMQVLLEKWFPNATITNMQRQIVFNIRIPRVLGAVLAGMLLSGAGTLMQSVLQNPLVSPYTLGVSNGAALGATVAIVFGSVIGLPSYSPFLVPSFAFIFAIISMIIVIATAQLSRDATKTLILAGVAVGYLISAITSFIKYMADTVKLPELIFWSMGGLAGVSWQAIYIMLFMTVISSLIMLWKAPDFHIMTAGEETALSLGINYKLMRNLSFILATLMTAVSVSFTGVIGFIGLVAPHLSRMIVGNDFRYSCLASSLLGSLLLLISDTLARTIIAPTELPVGIITSVLGVPFFLFLIIRKGREY